ncbi:MAG: TonB-dependent receptor [Dysgonamonadaceae bacterium]|nr:TonB-dependent receptor [Dysgonamonadaceae bacterium]
MPNKYVLLILLVFGFALPGFCQYTIRGRVIDAQNKQPLEFVTVQLPASELWAVSNEKGAFVLTRVPRGKSVISVKYLGYAPKTLEVDVQADVDNLLIALTESNLLLGEVVVTASESKGMTSASKIGQIAMQHLQPTSFTDLLELLPGGKSVDPNMGSANFIKIREAGSASSMSSLGVGFVIDGAQVNTDANLQYLQGTAQGGKESVSQGVDMRTLSTDNIESVEIVRGIPSVEYGNLTNGLVNIRRKATASLLTARIKADQVGKLFSAGKGWNVAGGNVLNVDLNYLDSKVDPRDSRENYQRITASARLNNRHRVGSGYVNRRINVDYTGSFDDVKRDKDVTAKEDSYKSSYDKMSASGEWNWTLDVASLLRSLRANAAISQEISKISELKSFFIDRPMGIPSILLEGVADGLYRP